MIITYNIIYLTVDDEVIDLEPKTYTIESEGIVLPADMPKAGYNFVGWVDGENEPSLSVVIAAGSTESKVFIAIWVLIEYNITYILNDGENDENNPLMYTIEDGFITLRAAQKEGFTFDGWEDEEGNLVDGVSSESMRNIVLIAKWTALI